MIDNITINDLKEHIINAENSITVNNREEVDELLIKVFDASKSIDDIFDKDEILSLLSIALAKNRNCLKAEEAANNIWDEYIKVKSFCHLLEECSDTTTKNEREILISSITNMVQNLKNQKEKSEIFNRLLLFYLNRNRPDRAFSLIKYFNNKLIKIEKSCDIVVKYYELGLNDEAEKLFTKVSEQARKTIGVEQKSKALALIENTQTILNEHREENPKAEFYRNILNANKLLKNALNTLNNIEYGRGIPLCDVTEVFIKLGENDKALNLIKNVKKLSECTNAEGERSCYLLYRLSILYLHMNMLPEVFSILQYKCGRSNTGTIFKLFIEECVSINKLEDIVTSQYLDSFQYSDSFHDAILNKYIEKKQYTQAIELTLKSNGAKSKYKKLYRIISAYIQEEKLQVDKEDHCEYLNGKYDIHNLLEELEKLAQNDQLYEVAHLYSLIGEKNISNDILEKYSTMLDKFARKIQDSYFPSETSLLLENIATLYAENGKTAKAIEIYNILKSTKAYDASKYENKLVYIAKIYIAKNEYNKALKINERITSYWDKTDVTSELLYQYAKDNQFNELLKLVQSSLSYCREEILAKSVDLLDENASREQMEKLFSVIIKEKSSSTFIDYKIIKQYLKYGEIDKALKFAHNRNNSSDFNIDQALSLISEEFINQGNYDDALSLFNAETDKKHILYKISKKHASDGEFQKALEIANNFDEYRRGDVFLDIARKYFEKNQIEDAFSLLKKIPKGNDLYELGNDIFNYFLEHKRYENAIQVIDFMSNQESGLYLLGLEYIKNDSTNALFNMIDRIDDNVLRVRLSTKIAIYILDNNKEISYTMHK